MTPRRYSSEDVHRAIFPDKAPKAKTLAQLKDGKRQYILTRAQNAAHDSVIRRQSDAGKPNAFGEG